MVYCVGLTGNIASGKTTVANLFSDFGVDVFSADIVAKKLTLPGTEAYKKILKHYGPDIIQSNGEINRRNLREIIFADDNERAWLEKILHPLIREQLAQKVTLSTSPYAVVEIPLLKDKALYPYLDRVLVIIASPDVQISRVMIRDNCNKDHAKAILSAQPQLEHRLQIADDIVVNDAGYGELKTQIEGLHHKYLEYSQKEN